MKAPTFTMRPMTPQEQTFFEFHIPLVYKYLAEKCARVTHEREDLKQDLLIGLAVAVMTYDPSRGTFANHAFWRFRAVRTAFLLARKKQVRQTFTDVEHDEIRIDRPEPKPKVKLNEFREYVFTKLTSQERESITELAWQRVDRRLMTVADIARRDRLRLKVLDKIREDFGGEARRHYGKRKKQKQRARRQPDHGRSL